MNDKLNDDARDFIKNIAGVMQNDQQREALAGMAGTVFGYFGALKETGFNDQQALYLTAQFQVALLQRKPN